MKDMSKLLDKKKKSGMGPMNEVDRHAKMSVLHELRNQAAAAMGQKLKGAGPGATHPQHGSVAGIANDKGPGALHPQHGTDPGVLKLHDHKVAGAIDGDDDDGPGDPHPEHGSVAGVHDAEGPGDVHPEHGSVTGEHDAEGPGDHDSSDAPGEGEGDEYSHLGVDEIDKHLQKLMAHKKRLSGHH